MIHQIRIYSSFQLVAPKSDDVSPGLHYTRIDPLRLHKAVERLYESHPVLCTNLTSCSQILKLLVKRSRTAGISVRTAPLFVPVDGQTISRTDLVKKKMEKAGIKTCGCVLCVAYSLEVGLFTSPSFFKKYFELTHRTCDWSLASTTVSVTLSLSIF